MKNISVLLEVKAMNANVGYLYFGCSSIHYILNKLGFY